MHSHALSLVSLAASLLLVRPSHGYIPAKATNDSTAFTQSDDLLHLAYYNGPFSVFSADVSRQLLAEGFGDDGNYTNSTTIVPWTRYSKGVLLHFDETLRSQPPAAVPWLAMINCDTNGTSFSDVDDIFTICRDLGAQAAVLYSLTAQGCAINEEYIADYEKVLDVYATTSLQNARIIESQFGNVNSSAWKYDSEALNASATLIEALLANNALSVVGNVPINVTTTTTDGDLDDTSSSTDGDATASTSSFFPSEVSVVTSPSSGTATEPLDTTTTTTSGGGATRRRRLVRQKKKRQQQEPTSTLFSSSNRAGPSSAVVRVGSSSSPVTTRTASGGTATKTSSLLPTVAINYLGAVVAARNLTVGGLNASSAPTPTGNQNRNDGPSTGLAMIILYSITGVVTFLFFTVILCGAVRAIRYPERYGPRAGFGYRNHANGGSGIDGDGTAGGGGGAQNRAQGLARAVLDTFPIVRFGGGGGGGAGTLGERREDDEEVAKIRAGRDEGKEVDDVELVHLAPVLSALPRHDSTRSNDFESTDRDDRNLVVEEIDSHPRQQNRDESSSSFDRPMRPSVSIGSFHTAAGSIAPLVVAPSSSIDRAAPVVGRTDQGDPSLGILSVVGPSPPIARPTDFPTTRTTTASATERPRAAPDADDDGNEDEGGQMSCPICVCDFTEGDSIRILPCDARHQFHVECIDPWLLGVSRLCPLCRLDLGEQTTTTTTTMTDPARGGRQGGQADGAPERTGDDARGVTTTGGRVGSDEVDEREATERERERHEEERVVRHLRGLLHRGSTSTSAAGIGVESGGGGGRRRTRSDSQGLGDSLDLVGPRDTVGLRSRFAKYVAAKRRRRDTSTAPSTTIP